jgi:hypothetical protein
MVIGIDSYHDSAKKGRSVGGVVASINPALTNNEHHIKLPVYNA